MIKPQLLVDRFNEIKLPGSFGRMSVKAQIAFFQQKAWLVVFHRPEVTLVTVVRQRKDGVWENLK